MKKIIWAFFISFVFLFLISGIVLAKPCGGDAVKGLVPCGQDVSCPCEIQDFFLMLARIFEFAVKFIAMPLAVLMLAIGGILIMISAGNPNMASLGKKTLYAAIIGLVLVFGAWLIIDFILGALGYKGAWSVL